MPASTKKEIEMEANFNQKLEMALGIKRPRYHYENKAEQRIVSQNKRIYNSLNNMNTTGKSDE